MQSWSTCRIQCEDRCILSLHWSVYCMLIHHRTVKPRGDWICGLFVQAGAAALICCVAPHWPWEPVRPTPVTQAVNHTGRESVYFYRWGSLRQPCLSGGCLGDLWRKWCVCVFLFPVYPVSYTGPHSWIRIVSHQKLKIETLFCFATHYIIPLCHSLR